MLIICCISSFVGDNCTLWETKRGASRDAPPLIGIIFLKIMTYFIKHFLPFMIIKPL